MDEVILRAIEHLLGEEFRLWVQSGAPGTAPQKLSAECLRAKWVEMTDAVNINGRRPDALAPARGVGAPPGSSGRRQEGSGDETDSPGEGWWATALHR